MFRGPGDRQAPIFRQESEGECGSSRAARADGAVVWVWHRRIKQLARMERGLMAHTTALGTADAAKWVKRREHYLTQPCATISTSRTAGLCRRPAPLAPPPLETPCRVGQTGLLFRVSKTSCGSGEIASSRAPSSSLPEWRGSSSDGAMIQRQDGGKECVGIWLDPIASRGPRVANIRPRRSEY